MAIFSRYSSKDDDDYGASKSHTVKRVDRILRTIHLRGISFLEALDLVVQGRMTAQEVFAQVPELAATVDKVAQVTGRKDFRSLPLDEQTIVITMLRDAIRGSATVLPAAPAKSSTAVRPMALVNASRASECKSWWKFW